MVTGFLLCVTGSPAHSIAANVPCSGSQPLSHGFLGLGSAQPALAPAPCSSSCILLSP